MTLAAMTTIVACGTKTNNDMQPTKHAAMTQTKFKTIQINGLDIFYREAGDRSNPTILFLHGFPSSSYMYRDVMNDLADKYHVVAPDYPGFGQSSAPSPDTYKYTFDNISATIDQFIDALELKKFSVYMQDYGGPVGLRIAQRRPELIQSLIIQNANAYDAGVGEAARPFVNYLQNPNEETEREIRKFLTADATKWHYLHGVEDSLKISPDSYIMDQYYLDREGNDEIQLALFRNYKTNFERYSEWHEYFRQHQPETLIIWGANDLIFTTPGAEAYKKDLPHAELHLLNSGHFLLEEHHEKAALLIDNFLSKLK